MKRNFAVLLYILLTLDISQLSCSEHQESKIHQVFLPPPKHFARAEHEGSAPTNNRGGFHRDEMRDQQLFGLTGSASSLRNTVSSGGKREEKYFKSQYDKHITRNDRKERYENIKPLNSLNKPKYSNIERLSKYLSIKKKFPKTEKIDFDRGDEYSHDSLKNTNYSEYEVLNSFQKADKKTTFIDASRFDYDISNYDYIEDEVENDFKDFENHEDDNGEVNWLQLKRKYIDEKLSALGLNKAERRNVRIHIPSKSSNRPVQQRPKKKIIIRRFKKSPPVAQRRSSMGTKRQRTLTPAEKYYLAIKSLGRAGKLRARSISDSEESESYSHHGLHGHNLEANIVRDATGWRPENFQEPQKIQFQIHGQGGPNSYRFGHDTGLGYNRQFRYEERDDYGHVKGRYGYYDQTGDLKIVNYSADPHTGYHVDIQQAPA